MSGISSKAAGSLENKNEKFQGQPLDDDLGLNWYGFKWRNHDPQIGRFIQIDPLAADYTHNSPYAFSENHVTAHVELEGLEKVPINQNSNPLAYINEGFRQYFAAAGDLLSFKAEVHVNKEQQTKVKVGTTEVSQTTTISENKVEAKLNVGEYFRTAGGADLIEVNAESNVVNKTKLSVKGNIGDVPVAASSELSTSASGTKVTLSAGIKPSADLGIAKVEAGTEAVYSRETTGGGTIKQTGGVKISIDATLVRKTMTVGPTSITTQTKVGGSVSYERKF